MSTEHHSKGTVLIIEDEAAVMEIVRQSLERLGWQVLGGKTGMEALDIVRKHPEAIDLALLDISLPDINGHELYPKLIGVDPNLKVVVCSGYSQDGTVQGILDAGAQGFVQKPFVVADISEMMEKIIQERSTTTVAEL